MKISIRMHVRRRSIAAPVAALAVSILAPAAPALASATSATRLYWSANKALRTGSGGTASTLFSGLEGATGVALDPANGKVYWAEFSTGEIKVANIDGSGAPETLVSGLKGPTGIALDKQRGKLYWVDEESGEVQAANIDGTEVQTLFTEASTETSPVGVAVSDAEGKIYWSDWGNGKIMRGSLEGETAGEATAFIEGEAGPESIAIDSTKKEIFWADANTGEIRASSLNSAGPKTLYVESEGEEAYPWGIAVDPKSGEIYWTDRTSGKVMAGGWGGEGSGGEADALYEGEASPEFLAVLEAPAGSPLFITGAGQIGQPLRCIAGEWEEGEPSASFYHAPESESVSYKWLREGTPISGQTASVFTPSQAGSYTCEITAANASGSTSLGSAAVTVASGALGAIVYWADYGSGEIRRGGLPTALGGLVEGLPAIALFAGQEEPEGIALDPATGKVYWVNEGGDEIEVGNLDGSGVAETLYTTPEGSNPSGVAVDAAAGKIYWTEMLTGRIMVGSLAGGEAKPLYEGQKIPTGLAADPSTGKLYWTNRGTGEVVVGSLDGSGAPETLYTDPKGSNVTGVAVDAAAGKIYWGDRGTEEIRVASLGGGGTPETLFTAKEPWGGLAIDAATGKIYWSEEGPGNIRVGNLDGTGTPETLFEGEEAPVYLALLQSPQGVGAPVVSGGGLVGQALSCSVGSWAADMPESALYRAPASFSYQWLDGSTAVAGATGASFTPSAAGSYSCEVTAGNEAGVTSQGSAAVTVTTPTTPPPTTTPPPAATPKVKIASKAVVKHGKAHVKIACETGSACSGKVVLKVVMRKRSHKGKRHHAVKKLIVIGHASYAIAAGSTKSVAVKLSRKALRLLKKARHHKLKAKATVTVAGGEAAHRKVTLVEAKRGKGRHKHHGKK